MLNSASSRSLVVAASVFIIDQVTKLWIIGNFVRGQSKQLTSYLNIVYARNTGVAFGLLNSGLLWQKTMIIGVAVLASIIILVWAHKLASSNTYELNALGFILGGALGNLCDRLWYGYVIDFLDFHAGTWHWYTFNIADVAICLGAIMLIVPWRLQVSKK